MEFIDEAHKVIGRVNILVLYDSKVKILLNRRLCELVVWLFNVARRRCLPVWKRCEAAIPMCQLALKEFYRQLVLGETLVQVSSSRHFWKLRKREDKLESLHSCDSALDGWEIVTFESGTARLECQRLEHGLKLSLEGDQYFVEHSCYCAGGNDGGKVPIKFREGKVVSMPCNREHWLKLSIITAPQGAFMVQFLLDFYWHIVQVNLSFLASHNSEGEKLVKAAERRAIYICNIHLSVAYEYLRNERENGMGSVSQCRQDSELLRTKLQYVIDQGARMESRSQKERFHVHRNELAKYVLGKLADQYKLPSQSQFPDEEASTTRSISIKNEGLPKYLNINRSKVKLGANIGSGGSAAVYRCFFFGERLAQKTSRPTVGANQKSNFENELEILYKLKHFHIVQLVGYFTVENGNEVEKTLLLELMDKLDLSKNIEERVEKLTNSPSASGRATGGVNVPGDATRAGISQAGQDVGNFPPYPLHVTVDIMLQIARGMKYLHDSGILHRDLKNKNILVKRISSNCNSERIDLSQEGYLYIKITDFGLSNSLIDTPILHGNVGTSHYKAPEVIDKRVGYEKPADVYSFAITCSEIFTGKKPFSDRASQPSEPRPSLSNCPPYLVDYIGRCWDTNPQKRPTFADICIVLLHYKSVLMRSDFTSSPCDYRISSKCDIVELARHGGLDWLTNEALQHGIDTVQGESLNHSRIPRDVLLECLESWGYPEGEEQLTATAGSSMLDQIWAVEPASQETVDGSLLEGFENLCLVHYAWKEVLLKGLREAWFAVGDHYASWESAQHDFEGAIPWYERAAAHGYAYASLCLGICYESGYGVEKDIDRAIEYYKAAAEKRSPSGCVYLGLCYITHDDSRKYEGIDYLRKAVQYQDSKKAIIRLIKLMTRIMLSPAEDYVYDNAMLKLLRLTFQDNFIGRRLLAGPPPNYDNTKNFVEALRKSPKHRATKINILRNLSMEPPIAEKIAEAKGCKVLLNLFKESCELDSQKHIVDTYFNVLRRIEGNDVLLRSLGDSADPSLSLSAAELERFYKAGQDQSAPSSPRL